MSRTLRLVPVLALALAGCASSSAKKDAAPGSGGSTGGGGSGGGTGTGSGGTTGGTGGAATGGSGGRPAADAAVGTGGAPAEDAGRLPVDVRSADASAAGTGPAGSPCVLTQQYGDPLPDNKTAMMIASGFTFVEGPVWIASQKALYFSDIIGTGFTGSIKKYTPADGKVAVFVDKVGTNGLAVDGQGMIVAATHDMQRLSRFDPATGMRTAIPGGDMYMGKPFDSVNDLVVRRDGNIYFTDPNYQQGGRPGQDTTAYYRLSPAGVVTRIAAGQQPNGIGLSPDGRMLYVASTGGDPLKRYALAADGSIAGDATVVSPLSSDGLAIDCGGNLYLTTNNVVRVIAPDGKPIGDITGFTMGGPANVAFGGDDAKTLFITAGKALYQLKVNVPGLPD
jgi:gluconolactonase